MPLTVLRGTRYFEVVIIIAHRTVTTAVVHRAPHRICNSGPIHLGRERRPAAACLLGDRIVLDLHKSQAPGSEASRLHARVCKSLRRAAAQCFSDLPLLRPCAHGARQHSTCLPATRLLVASTGAQLQGGRRGIARKAKTRGAGRAERRRAPERRRRAGLLHTQPWHLAEIPSKPCPRPASRPPRSPFCMQSNSRCPREKSAAAAGGLDKPTVTSAVVPARGVENSAIAPTCVALHCYACNMSRRRARLTAA